VPRLQEAEREEGNKQYGKESGRELRRSSNSIYEYLTAPHHRFVDRHLAAGALSAVAILEFKLSVAQSTT
jgi:hypothetical protein